MTPRGAGQDTNISIWRLLRPFFVWLAAFYAVWLAIVVIGDHWTTLAHHWQIAVAMAAGSYFAGSTPMGGGTVGFPILVLLLDEPARMGRDFSLAVQSIGMVSAAIFIFAARRPIQLRVLGWAMLASLIVTPLSLAFIAPLIGDLTTKLIFAVTWCSFGILTIYKIREMIAMTGITPTSGRFDRDMGLAIGVIGGVAASMTGVGIDMVLYAVLALLYRADLKISVPTSVAAMAFTSVVGVTSQWMMGRMDPAVFGHWLAAAPIVAIGAPFGAIVVQYIPRAPTLLIVASLCVGQFVWTMLREGITGTALIAAFGGVLVCNLFFHILYNQGSKLQGQTNSIEDPAPTYATENRMHDLPDAVS